MKHFFVLTGPESTGKTTLAQQLTVEWNMPLVPEFARQYLENKVDSYTLEDVDFIGQKQWELELATEGELVICDTDLLTIYIWKKRFSMLRIQPYFHCSKRRPGNTYFVLPTYPGCRIPCGKIPWTETGSLKYTCL